MTFLEVFRFVAIYVFIIIVGTVDILKVFDA